MYTIGVLSFGNAKKNVHLGFISEKGWKIETIKVENVREMDLTIKAIIIEEGAMAQTCSQLIRIKSHIQKREIPIYILSKGNSEHNIVYLQLGAEACFSTIIDPHEFHFTLANLLNHYYSKNLKKNEKKLNQEEKVLQKSLELLPEKRSVIIEGKTEVFLTKKEYGVLDILYANVNKPITYGDFEEKLWGAGSNSGDGNYKIANTVFHLRKKLKKILNYQLL